MVRLQLTRKQAKYLAEVMGNCVIATIEDLEHHGEGESTSMLNLKEAKNLLQKLEKLKGAQIGLQATAEG